MSGSGSARLPEQGPKATCATPTACPKFPESNTSTNPKFLFLREIGVNCLRGFLLGVAQAGPDGPHWGGTLVIDRLVTLTKPLQIPAFFTLAGVGMHGAGRLVFVGPFEGPFKDQPAIHFQENNDKVAGAKSCIRDLAIEGPGSQVLMRGLKVGSQQVVLDDKVTAPRAMGRVQIHNVRVSGFGVYGVQGGMNTYTVLLDCCEFSDNKVNIQLVHQCNSWRIRDCIISGATQWGIDIGFQPTIDGDLQLGAVSDALIFGCRFEDNSPGAIRVRPGNNDFTGALNKPSVNTTSGVQVLGNSFERNSVAVKIDDARALLVADEPDKGEALFSPLSGTRIVSNLFGDGESVVLPNEEKAVLNIPAPPQGDMIPLWTQLGFNAIREGAMNMPVINLLRARRSE